MSIKEDFLSAIETTLDNEGQKMRTAMREEINASGMTDQGSLAGDIKSRTSDIQRGVRLTMTGVRYAPYASAIRESVPEGTRPGYWPREAPIRRWVQSKLSPPEPKLDDTVFFIQRAIRDEGTPTNRSPVRGEMNWAERAVDRRLEPLIESLEAAMANAFESQD